MPSHSVCFVGLFNLPVLAREFNNHHTGGEEVQQTLLAKAFARRGYPVSMVVADYGQQDGQVWHGVKTYKAFKPDAGIPMLRFFHPRWSGLWAALKRANADVYYVSTAGAHVGQVVAFARAHGRRVIFRIAHDANCDPAKVMIKYWRDRKLYGYGLRRADSVLAQTVRQQETLKKNFGLESRLAAMLVDPAEQDRTFAERDTGVLWVNNFRPFKRPELLVDLALQLPSVHFQMVGGPLPGLDKFHAEVRERARSASNLTFRGRVPYHDVNDLYERARVFVNTSDTEGFPNSYLQAWARGTPVVAFFDPDGLIAREGLGMAVTSLTDMREAVKRLLDDPQLWQTTSLNCKAFMEREYGERRVLTPYLDEVRRCPLRGDR